MRFTVGNYRDQHIRHPRPKPGSRQPGRKLSSRRFLPTTRLIAPGSPRMHRRRYIEKSTCRRSRTLRLSLTFKDRTVVSARERQPSACVWAWRTLLVYTSQPRPQSFSLGKSPGDEVVHERNTVPYARFVLKKRHGFCAKAREKNMQRHRLGTR